MPSALRDHSTSRARLVIVAALFLWLVLAAIPAHALRFEVVELSQECSNTCFGSPVTIGVRVSNPNAVPIFGLGASVTGYDPSVASFQQGSAVSSILDVACVDPFGCFGGLPNGVGPHLSESNDSPLGPEVQFFNGVVLGGSAQTGEMDPGIDGVVGGGDAQFRLTFVVNGAGSTALSIGPNLAFGDAVITTGAAIFPTPAIQVVIHSEVPAYVIPEPGTGLLLGLGLLGLSRRSS